MDIRKLFLTTVAISASAFSQDQQAGDLQDLIGRLTLSSAAAPVRKRSHRDLGVIRAKLAKDGTFTGTLERATFPDGSQFPALVFKGTPLLPDLAAPKSIPVDGQYTGRNVSLIVKYGDDPRKWIFGIGFSTHDPFKPIPGEAFVVAAGSTVGPEIGDQGDWQREIHKMEGPKCRDVYVNGVYHCTICEAGTVVM